MELLLENNDTLICLLNYIKNYNYYNYDDEEENKYIDPNIVLYILCHTNHYFRHSISNEKNEFPKIKNLMINYKEQIIIPKLKEELKEIENRKYILENSLKILPIKMKILRNSNLNKIYINYKTQIIHYEHCNYYSVLDYVDKELNKIMNHKNLKLPNPLSLDKYLENYSFFINFKICDNSLICKCLYNEIQNSLRKN
jgi:hypothetical protein